MKAYDTSFWSQKFSCEATVIEKGCCVPIPTVEGHLDRVSMGRQTNSSKSNLK